MIDAATPPSSSLRWLAGLAGLLGLAACTSLDGGDGAPGELGGAALTGTIRAYVADHADGTSTTGYALERGPYDHVELPPSPAVIAHLDQRVTITRDAVVALEPPTTTVLPHTGGAATTVRVAVVLLDFQGVPPQSFTPATAQARLATVRDYYRELSYGSWTIEPAVFGPYTVARPADCDLDTIGALARQAATAAGVAIAGYDHVGVTLPANSASGLDCACGLAWLGRSPAQPDPGVMHTSLYTCTDANAFAHELGHGFGLHHAATANCQGQVMRRDVHEACAIAEYGNQFNTMGNGLGHMNGFQKATMRWLNACNHVRASRDATFELVPIQSTSTGVQTLQLATGDQRDGRPVYYYVEYRNPALATFNAGGNPPREQGVGVHVDVAPAVTDADGDRRPILLDVSPGTPGGFADPRLTAGRSFTDPDGRVTVNVLETAADRARVQVTFPGGGGGVNTCADGTVAPGSDGPASGGALFQHCAYGGWAAALAPGDYTAAQLVAAGAVDDDASSLQLQPGYEATLFDGPDFTGDSLTVTGAADCLVAAGWNDRVSSLRLRAVAGPDGPDGDAGTTPDGDGGPGGDAGAGAEGDGAAGCGCGAGATAPGAAWLALGLLGLPWRRRRHR